MSIILLSLATITVAQTSRVTVSFANNDDQRSVIPVMRVNNVFRTSNGYQFVPSYVYSRNYDGAQLSDAWYQGQGVNFNRRYDIYSNQYGSGPWVSPVTEPTMLYNNNKRNTNVFDYVRQMSGKNATISDEKKRMNSSVNTRDNSQQSHGINDQQITFNQTSDDKVEPSFKNNNKTQSSSDNTSAIGNNNEDNNSTNMLFNTKNQTINKDTKIIQDNELTTAYLPRTGEDEDKWIWSDGNETMRTTIPTALDDRAAFEGNKCPNGQMRLNNSCVAVD